MSFIFQCPFCKQEMICEDAWDGFQAQCPSCNKDVTLRKQGGPILPESAPPESASPEPSTGTFASDLSSLKSAFAYPLYFIRPRKSRWSILLNGKCGDEFEINDLEVGGKISPMSSETRKAFMSSTRQGRMN